MEREPTEQAAPSGGPLATMGAGLDLEIRIQIVTHIFTVSNSTTVHMKDRDSGQPGMLPFVNGILNGLAS